MGTNSSGTLSPRNSKAQAGCGLILEWLTVIFFFFFGL